jgi:Protein of unknown function (DUF3306)
MTERENFFERWSRRKVEAERQAVDAAREPDATQSGEDACDNAQAPAEQAAAHQTSAHGERSALPERDMVSDTPDVKSEFDPARLPSLESITAASDVSAFLRPGVPVELTRAALRRAWVADPAIRDFKGLAENDWDFTDPKAMAGFGDLPADFDVSKIVAQLFGDSDRAEQPKVDAAQAAPSATRQQATELDTIDAVTEVAGPEIADQAGAGMSESGGERPDSVVRRNNNIAVARTGDPQTEVEEAKTVRTHGRALPQ